MTGIRLMSFSEVESTAVSKRFVFSLFGVSKEKKGDYYFAQQENSKRLDFLFLITQQTKLRCDNVVTTMCFGCHNVVN